MRQGVTTWHFECAVCGLEASTLEPVDLAASDAVVNEADREAGLEALRRRGFQTTIDMIRRWKPSGRLLDVGCAHGWFLDAGMTAGYACTGIEPSVRVAERGVARGHRILTGYFPSALESDGEFDVISFNDVFEHIPGARETMRMTSAALANKGILSIAIPASNGFFYKVSKTLGRAGIHGPFERMWQKHFSSPHLYYFNDRVLTRMANDCGLHLVYRGTLPSVRLAGLWARLTYDTTASQWKNLAVYAVVIVLVPFLRLLPQDIDLLLYEKRA
jgi:SAM-dependent methyltransferase